ncbi:MAG: Hsp70 family protein [Pyrinomonadaceae bacterium]|nr:Hsp70 family protein [Pyrinomonadaceae bacterium]
MRFIGIDFGTSNSLASLVENDRINFVNFPDGGISNPTILYFPAKSKQHYIGNDAVRRYLINLEESGSGGRLMLSIKTILPEAKFDYTMVAGFGRLTAEDLVAKFLSILKQFAEKQFGEQFDGVVLGRPVQFNEIAVSRLEKAAQIAGFKTVVFWLEPVAAALAYEMTAAKDELICVVDIGGGTSDVCVIETSAARSASPDRLGDIKAIGGVYEAGDELNAQIMKHRLAPRFGAGSTFKSLGKTLPFPSHIIYKLSKWHRINLLNNRGDKETLQSIRPSSDRPEDVERLLNLINHHYGFELFRAIDVAKRHLSDDDEAIVKFSPLDLREAIEIKEFEEMIGAVAEKIEASILDTLTAASVKPNDIERVLLTGGTSQVPVINRSVIKIFGADKILRPDYFSSVATGLGYAASRLK